MILDTNALSALADGDQKLLQKVQNEPALALPVIVLGEYRYGIADSRYRAKYEAWLKRDLELFLVLNITEDTTRYYADLRIELKKMGAPIPANDCWIAAIALQYDMPVVTRDRHFSDVPGLGLVSW